jgi:Tol biopolymer transport system component/DNA-binding winged helix-turn-helix (wHTH) protein
MTSPAIYEFDQFRVDAGARQVWRDGHPLALSGKALDILLLLLRHHDRALTKEELLEAVWPGTFVSEDSLTHNVSALRRAFGDAEFIATIPRRGYRFIGDLRLVAAEAPAGGSPEKGIAPGDLGAAPEEAVARPAPTARPVWAVLTAVVAVSAVVIGATMAWRARPPGQAVVATPMQFAQSAPAGAVGASGGALSPDGTWLAFVARDAQTGTTALWVRALDASAARVIPGSEGAWRPFWSPDGSEVAFFAGGRLRAVAINDGPLRTIASTGITTAGGTWGASGQILFSNWTGPVLSVPATGGEPVALTSLDTTRGDVAHQWPALLADGRRLVYFVASQETNRSGWYVAPVGTPDAGIRILDAETTAVLPVPSGHVLVLRDGVLAARTLGDDGTLGEPTVLAGDVLPPARVNGVTLSASANGLLAFETTAGVEQLAWFDRSGLALGTLETPTTLHNPTLSPDDVYVVATSFGTEQAGIWRIDLERGAANRLMRNGAMPMPSPDGASLAFSAASPDGTMTVFRQPLDATEPVALVESSEPAFVNDWSRDGRFLTYGSLNPDTREDLWVLSLDGARQPWAYVATPANEIQGRISPDSRWMAYASDESGRWEVYVQSFPEPGSRQTVSVGGGAQPQWRADGRELYYVAPDWTLMAVAADSSDALTVGSPEPLFRLEAAGTVKDYRAHYAPTTSGDRFLVDTVQGASLTTLTVMVNWPAHLAR